MSFTRRFHSSPRGSRFGRLLPSLAAMSLTTALSAVAGGSAALAADLSVEVNQTQAFKLGRPAASVMVGNPSIADVTIENSDLLYVIGRHYGKTNIVALDAEGRQITDVEVSVIAEPSTTVTLTRGAAQLSYNCTPRCERTLDPTDDPGFYEPAFKNTKDRQSFATESSR